MAIATEGGPQCTNSSSNSGMKSEMGECERSHCSNIRRAATPRAHFLQIVGRGKAVVYGQIFHFLHQWVKLV